jgi:hypothetical protein
VGLGEAGNPVEMGLINRSIQKVYVSETDPMDMLLSFDSSWTLYLQDWISGIIGIISTLDRGLCIQLYLIR